MVRERISSIDSVTLLAERTLGNREILTALLVDGENKASIVQQVVAEIAHDPVTQACFLRTLFRTMAKEGEKDITDRRDGAFAILTDQAMQPIIGANSSVLRDVYLEAIRQQTGQNDPICGSIDTLLEAGQVIAPHFPKKAISRQEVTHAWEQVAEQFSTIDEQSHIRSKLGAIRERMSPTWKIDAQVEQLREQGFSIAQITERLETKRNDIEKSVRRMLAAGRIKRARSPTETVAQLDRDVVELRGQELTNPQIAARLNKKEPDIRASVSRLIAAGIIKPRKRGRRPK